MIILFPYCLGIICLMIYVLLFCAIRLIILLIFCRFFAIFLIVVCVFLFLLSNGRRAKLKKHFEKGPAGVHC